jgi:hypothetical protein
LFTTARSQFDVVGLTWQLVAICRFKYTAQLALAPAQTCPLRTQPSPPRDDIAQDLDAPSPLWRNFAKADRNIAQDGLLPHFLS